MPEQGNSLTTYKITKYSHIKSSNLLCYIFQAIDDLLTLLKEENITVVTSESFAENPRNQVENIKVCFDPGNKYRKCVTNVLYHICHTDR